MLILYVNFKIVKNKAENIVYFRKFGEVRLLCEDHLNSVEDDCAEYITHCPNCNCVFGVN